MFITYTITHIARALAQLRNVNIDGIVIGSTCIDITLGRPSEGDIDLFTATISPLLDEDNIRRIAHQKGWSTGTTDLGTPSITLNINDTDITIELYENIMDFYIPIEALELCRRGITVEDININYIAPECWIVFKARRGSNKDIAELLIVKQMIDEGILTIDKSIIKRVLELYEEDKQYIVDRLKSLGITQ